jgi:hypothetical protein
LSALQHFNVDYFYIEFAFAALANAGGDVQQSIARRKVSGSGELNGFEHLIKSILPSAISRLPIFKIKPRSKKRANGGFINISILLLQTNAQV